jgi:ABC-type transport system substrate-binding protein
MKKANCVFLIGFILFLNLLSLNGNFSSHSIISLESASDNADDPLIVGTTSLGYDLDPAFASDRASLDIIDQVWEGLYAHNLDDPRLRIIPRLAADCGSWNDDATVFNVTLRSGITFHNGEAFTAADVNYTFSRLWELCVFHDSQLRELYFPNGFNTTEMNASVGYGYIINRTVIVDDLHVSFELNFPYVPFQSLLCFSGSYIVDESTTIINKYLLLDNINNGTAIGTGPYKVTIHSSYNCTFEYWEDYYRGVPAIKEIIFLKYFEKPGMKTEISQALLTGDIDIASSFDKDFIDDFEKNPDIYIGPYRERSVIYYLLMNNEKINKNYRHAINYAIDYDKIINEMYGNYLNYDYARRMTSIVPPGTTYHKECNVPILNITKARQILIEAGFSQGYGLDENSADEDWRNVAESDNPIFYTEYAYFLGNNFREDLGILIADNLKEIGIHVHQIGLYIFFGVNISKYDMYMVGWMPDYNDPCEFINTLLSNTSYNNVAQVNDPWLQLAMEEALTINNDADRKALYYDIQDYIATDLMPFVFISNSWRRNVRANYVITQPNPMYKFYIFPFSWHGVNTTLNDPYLEIWCNSGSPPVNEFWPEPPESIPGYPVMFISICFFVIIPLWIRKYKKQS